MSEVNNRCSPAIWNARNSWSGADFLLRVLIVVLPISLGAGCSKNRTSPVKGEVLLDGKPLAGASVQFISQADGRTATGETNQDGQFTMSTFEPGDGVLAGSYKVVISPPLGTADPAQYTTTEDAMNAAAKAPPKKATGPAFPAKYSRADQTPLTQDVPVKGAVTFELSSK